MVAVRDITGKQAAAYTDARLTTDYLTSAGTTSAIAAATTTLKSTMEGTGGSVKSAQDAATAAATAAGAKGKVLYQSSTPATSDRLTQNLWIDTTGSANTPKRWNGSAWVAVTDKIATDAAAAAAAAQTTANTVTANLTNNYYTKTATDSALAAASLSLESKIDATAYDALPSTFAEEGKYFSRSSNLAPASKQPLSSEVTFPIVDNVGKVLSVKFPTSGAVSIYQRGYLPYIAGHTYKLRVTLRHLGNVGTGNYLYRVIRKVDDEYNIITSHEGTWTSVAIKDAWETFEITYTATGDDAAWIYGGTTVPTGYDASGRELQIRLLEFTDVTEAAVVSATLTNNYYTKANTDSAIAASATTLNASIAGVSATVVSQGTALATLAGNASAGYLIKVQAGGNASILDLIAADGSEGSVSLARVSAEYIILDGTVSAAKLIVGNSKNMLVNSDFEQGLKCVTSYANGNGGAASVLSIRPATSTFTNGVRPVLEISQPTANTQGYFDAYLMDQDLNGTKYFDVDAGARYEFSAYISTHRCTAVVHIQFFDATGTALGSTSVSVPSNSGSSTDPLSWQRPVVFATAPATARYARIILRKMATTNGDTSSFLFAFQPMFALTTVNASQPQAYQASGLVYIDGGRIVANSVTAEKMTVSSLSAITATIGILRTATSGARQEIHSDKILIYDASNVVRVRIGNLS
jgi:hypothetical protein